MWQYGGTFPHKLFKCQTHSYKCKRVFTTTNNLMGILKYLGSNLSWIYLETLSHPWPPKQGGRPRNTKNYANMRRPLDQENYAIISDPYLGVTEKKE